MKLLDLYINGFGKFHEQSISFEDGINIIYGKNEAGKSTIHTFIRGMFFGIERQRGRASKNDLYVKFEPWENSGTYEGRLRLEIDGTIYRIERNFQKNNKAFTIINETRGKEEEPTKALMDQLLCGLSETTYMNTISIGQLKSATDNGMVTELKNYIANLNTSGNMSLNITKAAAFLKNRRKELESQMTPEAARTYTALLGEIRNIEKEISSPEFENQMQTYQTMRSEVKNKIQEKQQEKENLLQKIAKGRQILTGSEFSDQASITEYQSKTQEIYKHYEATLTACQNKSRVVSSILLLLVATLLLGGTGALYYFGSITNLLLTCGILSGISIVFYILGAILYLRGVRYQKELSNDAKKLQEIFTKHLGDSSISQDAMNAFQARIAEFIRLCAAVTKSESAVCLLVEELTSLQDKQNNCSEVIEKQQRTQWELEKKLEHLSNCKNQSCALKHIIEENDRLREEMAAIDLAIETMTELSTSIRDSFGLYLNKTASSLISGITGGIYNSMSVDENLNIFLNTSSKLVPIEQVSSGAMDQVYLALRLATAKLLQNDQEQMPLIFDDSFVLYDDDRLKIALKWLAKACSCQIIIFTCHQREVQVLTANQIPYHLITL